MTRLDAPDRPAAQHQTLAGYIRAFTSIPWDDLVSWPPDVFCLCNLVLDHTEAYRFVVAPPRRGAWPPVPGWNEQVLEAAGRWTEACTAGAEPPALVRRCWETILRSRDVPLRTIRRGDNWDVCQALLTLHAVADEACSGLSVMLAPGSAPEAGDCFEARAWKMLSAHGTLSHLSPSRVRIVPKTNFAARGITIRSLSRYLALFYESVDVQWRRVDVARQQSPSSYNIVLLPWPLSVRAVDFRPVENPLGNMDPEVFGFFEYAPEQRVDPEHVASLLRIAGGEVGTVDALVLPEEALRPDEVVALEPVLDELGVGFLVTGVRESPVDGSFGRNYVHAGVRTSHGWVSYQQDKHHRWCLDEGQIRQYHLSHSLDPHKQWWEAIDIRERVVHVLDLGGGATTASLVCEDLARLDEVADLLRRIGPSVVIALLLDGPQLASRWSGRYATILSDEPGSAVLTLTAYGMTARSRPPGLPPSRVVALWSDSVRGVREIELGRGAEGVLLQTSREGRRAWTADGRSHAGVPALTLSEVRQLRVRA